MSLDRQWYLYEKLRGICTDPEKADLVAPEPTQPKPKKTNTKSDGGDIQEELLVQKTQTLSKGRGRPRKTQDDSASVPSKRRGRPQKIVDVKKSDRTSKK